MSEMTPANGDQEKGEIILGDEASKQAISFKMAQAFYNEISGKSESISERFHKSFILTIDNIDLLHRRIIQSTTQYNVVTANVSFSVDYMNDSSERFSSFERFKAHAGSSGIPAEEVLISYSFLVVLPNTNKPQEYRINIRLISRAVKLEKILESTKSMPISIPMWRFDSEFTCKASISFIDITVANSFMSVVRTWNESLEEVRTNKALLKIRPLGRFLPAIFKYGLLFVGVYWSYSNVEIYFSDFQESKVATFTLFAYLFNFLLWKAGLFSGNRSKEYLDSMYEISYIKFSGADSNLADHCRVNKRNNTFRIFGFALGTLILGVASSSIASFLFQS